MPSLDLSPCADQVAPLSWPLENRVTGRRETPNEAYGDGLRSILPLLQAALWNAWADTFELISIDPGQGEAPSSLFDSSLRRPGVKWLNEVCPLDRSEVKAFFALDESDLAGRSIDYRIARPAGEPVWVRHWLLRRSVESGGRIRLSGLIMAIPEQKRLERECLLAREHERNRIGHELHDDVCQVLAGLSCMMEGLAGRLSEKAPELHREFAELNADVTEAMKRTRSMAHGLFPARLAHVSLRNALDELARQMKSRFGVAVALDLPRRLARHSPEQIIHVYRIVQEAVGNGIRHGGATEFNVVVECQPGKGVVRVEDNGKGFPPGTGRPDGMGLQVMRYRARILGGRLKFGNRPPAGAVIELKYPLTPVRPSPPGATAPS